MPYLLLLKFDIILHATTPAKVEYKIYNPNTKDNLNLYNLDYKINIILPLTLNNNSLELYYTKFDEINISIFNKYDPFFNDIF